VNSPEPDAIYNFKDKFNIEERETIWTSTEASGTTAVTKYWYTGLTITYSKQTSTISFVSGKATNKVRYNLPGI
jgi:hypothetical protein